MEERREVFDASAHMLFEVIGDSESLYSDPDAAEEDDGDDAQSCSYRWSARVHGGDEIRPLDLDYLSGGDDDDDEEEDGVVDQRRIGRLKAAEPAKSNGCDESSNVMMVMNESREGDKLFWEACLAS